MKIIRLCSIGFLFVTCSIQAETAEKIILGDWCAGSDNSFHEEFSLTIEDGEHVFSSWLHHRPDGNGTWEINKGTLTVKTVSGSKYIYSIKKATSKLLILQKQGEAPEKYVRTNCRRVELPEPD